MKKYHNITLKINEEVQEIGIAALSDVNFEGIVQDNDYIIITISEDNYSDNTISEIEGLFSEFNLDFNLVSNEVLNDKNWNEEFEKKVPAIHVSPRIGIAPEWKLNELNEEIQIKINPKMSFGTGEHSTTRLCCALMENIVQPESFWIDAGTGTGILAVLAIKLGAKNCFAFDNYEWSFENAKENCDLNGVIDKVDLQLLDIEEIKLPKSNGIAANIFTNLILKSLPLFRESLSDSKGDLVCSGILKYDRDLVVNNAVQVGFKLIEERIDEEWIAFHFKAE